MKKTVSLFIFCISLLLFPSALVRADGGSLIPSDNEITVTPSISQSDLDNANSIGYLFEILRQGGSIDCSNADDGYDLDDLIDDFYTDIWNGWRDLTGTTDTVYWINPFSDDIVHSQSVTYVKPNNQLYKTVQPLSNWLRQPKDDEGNVIPTPTPNPDYTYLTQLNQINGTGFNNFFDSIRILRTSYDVPSMQIWSKEYSFYSPIGDQYSPNFGTITIFNQDSVYIHSEGNTYSLQYNYSLIPNFSACNPADGSFVSWVTQGNRLNQFDPNDRDSYTYWGGWAPNAQNPTYATGSYSGTLMDCMNYLSWHFHNINIYVDGDLWSSAYQDVPTNVGIGGVTIVEGTNQPVEYTYDIDIYIPLDDIIDRLDTLIRQKQVITYPDISDLIVDVNGQPAVAVVDVSHETVDDWYVKNVLEYIPIFPMSVSYPVSDSEMVSIIEPAVSVIPDDIITVLGILFIGGLFVCLMQRLLE